MRKTLFICAMVTLISSFSAIAGHLTSKLDEGIYLGGFVQDENGNPLDNVKIIIRHNHTKLFSLSTMHDGWFETDIPIDFNYENDELTFIFLKRGFQFCQQNRVVDGFGNVFNFTLSKILDVTPEEADVDLPYLVKHGSLYSSQYSAPVIGALVTITSLDPVDSQSSTCIGKQHAEQLLGTGVTRKNGFYSAIYPKNCVGEKVSLKISHYEYDDVYDQIVLDSSALQHFTGTNRYSFSSSIGIIGRTGTYNDHTVLIGGISTAVAWFPTKITAVKHKFMSPMNTQYLHGFEVGAAISLAAEKNSDKGALVTLWIVTLGGVVKLPDSPFALNYGLAYDSYTKGGVFFGVEMPLHFFN